MNRAWNDTLAIAKNVTPEQFGDATPCQSWNVQALLNHMIFVPFWFADGCASGRPEVADEDRTGGDFIATFERVSRRR